MTEEPSGPNVEKGTAHPLSDNPAAEDVSRDRWLVWPARLWLLVALCGAGYLAAVWLSSEVVAGCGPQSGCHQVLSSHWAYWFGLPVSLPGCVVYGCLLAATLGVYKARSPIRRHRSRQIIIAFSVLILAAAG